jgi:hypothetical protein
MLSRAIPVPGRVVVRLFVARETRRLFIEELILNGARRTNPEQVCLNQQPWVRESRNGRDYSSVLEASANFR